MLFPPITKPEFVTDGFRTAFMQLGVPYEMVFPYELLLKVKPGFSIRVCLLQCYEDRLEVALYPAFESVMWRPSKHKPTDVSVTILASMKTGDVLKTILEALPNR